MMQYYSESIIEIIKKRFSCRKYTGVPLEDGIKLKIQDFLISAGKAPFNSDIRFELITPEPGTNVLKGLGTYGFIKNAPAFIAGIVTPSEKHLEDFGYAMEKVILFLTDSALGTCWLGGTFSKSSFADKANLSKGERIPAVASLGYILNPESSRNSLRRQFYSPVRFPQEMLFFSEEFGNPLKKEEAGLYYDSLEMVRLAPSASNKQPWRIIKSGKYFHFYMLRSKGYRESLPFLLLKIDDMQRIDIGIAMCHFELTSEEKGLRGKWISANPGIALPGKLTEYIASYEIME